MMLISLFILFVFSIFFEGALSAVPLVLVCLICLTISMRSSLLFLLAFVAGIMLDAFALRPLGGTSIFFLIVVFLILLYQRKYELNSYPFVFIASFVSSLLFLILFGYDSIFLRSLESTVIALTLFATMRIELRLSAQD